MITSRPAVFIPITKFTGNNQHATRAVFGGLFCSLCGGFYPLKCGHSLYFRILDRVCQCGIVVPSGWGVMVLAIEFEGVEGHGCVVLSVGWDSNQVSTPSPSITREWGWDIGGGGGVAMGTVLSIAGAIYFVV